MADPATLRVLIIDDDPMMVTLVRKLLLANGYHHISEASSAADALSKAELADLILLDYQLPDANGVDLIPRLQARANPPSIIMVTGEGNETLAATALRAGAADYLPKDGTLRDLLPQIVERVRRDRSLTEARDAVEQELIRAERLAAIGEMTVTLHHEINNPLMSAFAEVELLLAAGGLTAEQQEALDSVKISLARVRDILRKAGDLRQAQSTGYLTGLRMITLSGEHATGVTMRGKALVWIPDEEIARVTALLLRHAGFSVERVQSAREISVATARIGVSLVVLSTIGDTAVHAALNGFIPMPARTYAVVALVAGDPAGALAAGADHVVQLPFDPATLAAELVGAAERRHALADSE
ncbi:MAG: response regulator [Gemmatimonadota bacterium]